jgi:hypothetical protein
MSKDSYYVVIVPHADQAAQALATARVAGHVHATRHHPAAPRSAPKAAAPPRAAASKGGRAASPSHGGAPKSAAPKSGARGGSSGHRIRTWSVVAGDQKYDVTDFGTTCGYKIEHNGTIVWTGVVSGRGYDTHTTTLAADMLTEVLRLAYVGDQREAAKAKSPESAPAAPSSAAPKSETRAKPDRAAEATPKRDGKPKREGSPKRKAKASAPAKSAPPSAKPSHESKPPEKAKASAHASAAAEHGTAPKAEHGAEPKAKRRAKKAASPRNGPMTQRAPVTPPSAKPHAHHAASSVDDKTVLEGLMQKLRHEDPSTAEQSFAALKRIWLGGGREATVEWMKHHTFPSAVDAFSDWMEKHFETAQAMLEKAPHSAPKSSKVA